MNLPTQYELATIAATQTGTPRQQAQAAIALWRACGEELARESAFRKAVNSEDENRAKMMALFSGGETVSLEEFLRVTMPQSKPEDRARKFREWTRHSIAFHDKLEGNDLDSTTAQAIYRTRADGYSLQIAADLAQNFLGFLERDRREKNTARAKKGAEAKKSLGRAGSTKKTPQAKRKTPQGRR